jgi:predicted TIM-barrel fold metal-dependent hydrolase
MRPEYVERGPRLEVLDAQGVSRCVLFPGSLALSAEHYVEDTDALYANLSSFNRWYDETWGFNYQERLYATAVLSFRDVDRAAVLADEVIDRGARVVLLPTGPAYGRSPGDPHFDPVWARLNEAGVVVALHIMPFWYFDAISPAWGHDPDPNSWRMSAWQWMNTYGERPVIDTISALIFDNLFERFPRLNVLIAEHGASWVPHTLGHMDKSRGMGRNGPWIGGQLTDRPSAIFKEHVRVTPYPEDDIPRLVDELDGDDRVLVFGSDFPHAEGVVSPSDFEQLLQPLPDDMQRRIMGENAAAIFDA